MVGSIDPRCETVRGTHWPKAGRRCVWNSRRGKPSWPAVKRNRINRPDIWMQAIRSNQKKLLWHGGRPHMGPRPRGGKSRSPLEPHAAWVLDLTTAEPDLTLEAIAQRLLAGLGLKTSEAAVRRFFKRHAITFKKNAARRRTGSARRIPGSRTLEGKPGEPLPPQA